jgi:hypothetical protein
MVAGVNVIERPGRPKVRTTPFPKYEVVARTMLQERYNSERWTQMVSEPVRRVRPFWLFDSILDDRTTQTCRLCNGVLLPWDHVWWQSHKPPLHWGCRSIIRAVSRRTAARRRVTEVLPVTDVRHPFGTPPGKRARSFTPKQKPVKPVKKRSPPPAPPAPPAPPVALPPVLPPRPPIVEKPKFSPKLIAAAEKKEQTARTVDSRVEGVKKLKSLGINNVHFLSERADPNQVYELLRSQGADKLFAETHPLDHLTVGAKPIKNDSVAAPPDVIGEGCGGTFANMSAHRASFLKIGQEPRNWSQAQWVARRELLGLPEKTVLNPNSYQVISKNGQGLDSTITHEFGHAVHLHGTPGDPRLHTINQVVENRFNSKDREQVSQYSLQNHKEYFAESYAAYRLRGDEMKKLMPKAYAMVQDVLKLRGLPL